MPRSKIEERILSRAYWEICLDGLRVILFDLPRFDSEARQVERVMLRVEGRIDEINADISAMEEDDTEAEIYDEDGNPLEGRD